MWTSDKIVVVDITEQMLAEARQDSTYLQNTSVGQKTRPVTTDRDIVGSLAHQCVEDYFLNQNVPFQSTRTERLTTGDQTDIIYEDDYIDVKGHKCKFDSKWSHNQKFLIFDKQLEDLDSKPITHYCFVTIEPDYSRGYIFGVISTREFIEKSTPIRLQYDNHQILSRQLKNMSNYVWHT